MNRTEHLQWCKERALEYVDKDELVNAFASMGSDLDKHSETENHRGIDLGISLMVAGHLSTDEEMRKFINGFN